MSSRISQAPRGRPKTLNRNRVVDVAMQAYWVEGITGISLNEICRRCEVSKPGLYREFGNEEGLLQAVILAYQEQVLATVLQMLHDKRPFQQTLADLVSFVTSEHDGEQVHKGCLLVKMRDHRMQLSNATRTHIDQAHHQVLTAYEEWVKRAKNSREYTAELSPQLAAIYIDAQLSNALTQIGRGDDPATVRAILNVAFSIF